MTAAFDVVTIDVEQTEVAAAFWSKVLGLVELQREDGDRWIVLGEADGRRRIGLQRGPSRPGGVHLDLECSLPEFDDEVERLVALGARLLSPVRRESYGSIANLVDSFGYLFDLCAYVDTHP
jgi:predicted enzyme related to lactoylglutathione lyase